MSHTVVVKFPGDLAVFEKALAERAEEFQQVSGTGRSLGAIHHRFALGDGYLVVVDEWEDLWAFESFVSDPQFQAFAASIGASGAPEIWTGESITSPDEF